MVAVKRQKVIAGNWKMYKTIEESVTYIKDLAPLVQASQAKVLLAVPFTAIREASREAEKSTIVIGAQNMNDASEGAFTGEIAARMLKDAGAKFVILGHSERRRIFNESNEFINKKVKRATQEGLQVILCIGETLEERQNQRTQEVLGKQMLACLADVPTDNLAQLILAYEPVWAIGTNLAATPEMAQAEHHFCRQFFAEQWGKTLASHLVIQYGGSVNPKNAKELLDQPDIDGLLIGGASLSVESFSNIINTIGKS